MFVFYHKVIRMLFAVVAEFFVCWAPLHVLNTWYLFYPNVVYEYVGSTGISLVQLLAYISSCCNPITYCFMNRKFRQAFLGIFSCYRCVINQERGSVLFCNKQINSCCRLCCCCVCLDPEIAEAQARGGLQRNGLNKVLQNNSDVSGNDSTLYVGRASTIGRSGEYFQIFYFSRSTFMFSILLLMTLQLSRSIKVLYSSLPTIYVLSLFI